MRHPFALTLFSLLFGSTPVWSQSVSIKLTRALSDPAVCDGVGGGPAPGWDLLATIPDAQHKAIPQTATGIGMWINPHTSNDLLWTEFYDSGGESFGVLYGYQDAGYNFSHPQDSIRLDWDGWRWITMPLAAFKTNRANPPNTPNGLLDGTLHWNSLLHIQRPNAAPISSTVDVCGISFLP